MAVNFFEMTHAVTPDEIDEFKHVNNQIYLKWFNTVSLAHSTSRGWPLERHVSMGEGWVARRHEIEYLVPVKPGAEVRFRTWISSVEKVRCTRRYEIVSSDGLVLHARGATLWAWINYSTGRPSRISQDIMKDFGDIDPRESLFQKQQ